MIEAVGVDVIGYDVHGGSSEAGTEINGLCNLLLTALASTGSGESWERQVAMLPDAFWVRVVRKPRIT